MSSPTRSESPGSSIRSRGAPTPIPASAEDVLGGPAPSTDDTPTTITRNHAPVTLDDPGAGVRGRHLAHFELLEPIGVGGMAAVLRARDTQLDRLVALKILPPEMAIDPENVRRFHQEARSAAKLDHENIARVFFCGEDQRLHFIAFEFVEGENLRVLLERRGRLPVGEAVHYMLQVAAGLAHATRRGVVHRDIKPSNIIITPTGRAKLVDMGLARSLERHDEEDLTQSGVTLGTFDYISPEQALEPRDADVRSDIYSLGCTFYHVLTGRPPFPEGTASQKLLHHQRIRPADPRDIIPGLPVEVVQVLDRMMAKDPRDRFQSAEELVHQLLLLARRLGTATNVTEGVLTVEASIPNPPTSRPLLWAALAAIAVVVLVLVLDQTPSNPSSPAPRADSTSDPGDAPPPPQPLVQPTQTEVVSVGPSEKTPAVATYVAPDKPTLQHLLDWLADHATAPRIVLRLASLDVSGTALNDLRGLLLAAREEVVIRPRDPGDRPTIRLTYLAEPRSDKGPLVALDIRSANSRIEGIRFVLDTREAPNLEMHALLFGDGTHTVSRCEFIQAGAVGRPGAKRVASVVADAKRAGNNGLTLRDCVFLGSGQLKDAVDAPLSSLVLTDVRKGGQDAVVRRGAVKVHAENCFFGPHAAAFRLERGSADDSAVAVRHCSILLPAGRSAAFEFPSGAAGRVAMTHSVVCRLPGEGDGEASLIQQAAPLGAVVYRGDDNGYRDLDAFWVADDWRKARWTEFRARMLDGTNKDEHSRVLLAWPWKLDPARQLAALEEGLLGQAAEVDDRSSFLREDARPFTHLIGATAILGKELRSSDLPASGPPAGPRLLVVEPKGGDPSNGVFGTLGGAVEAARSHDTILVRHQDGIFEIDTVQFNKKGLGELTIRAARRYRPVLTLDDSSEAVATLFRVHYCKLSLEGLEFLLQSDDSKSKARTVVTLFGDGECFLRDCVVTLQKPDAVTTNLALATLVEPGLVMKPDMPTPRTRDQGPRLSLERCFVRGEGDLVWTRATRPFALDMKQSLATLTGSLLHLDAAPDSQAPPASRKVKLDLSRTTAYLKSSLVRIKTAKDVTGLVPVVCTANGCLFVPATSGHALIRLDAPEGEENALRDRFDWVSGSGNSYGDFAGQFSDATDMMPAAGMKWKMPGEDSKFGIKPAEQPPAGTRFSAIKPGQLTWTDLPSDTGAEVKILPVPVSR